MKVVSHNHGGGFGTETRKAVPGDQGEGRERLQGADGNDGSAVHTVVSEEVSVRHFQDDIIK